MSLPQEPARARCSWAGIRDSVLRQAQDGGFGIRQSQSIARERAPAVVAVLAIHLVLADAGCSTAEPYAGIALQVVRSEPDGLRAAGQVVHHQHRTVRIAQLPRD